MALRLRSGRSWLKLWVAALIVIAVMLGSIEGYWRSQGYVPGVIDSKALWSLQRDRVDSVAHPLVLLGASHTQYGIDLELLRRALPGYTPIMLAINGHFPLAILHQLALDDEFHGMVWVDIEADGMRRALWGHSQAWIDYYHHAWSPSLKFHRRILTWWQQLALIANPKFSALASLKHLINGTQPDTPPLTYHPDRSGNIDYSKTDAEALRKHFVQLAEHAVRTLDPPNPQQWLADLETVNDWVRSIQARGGEVIFYRTPTQGKLRQLASQLYPRDRYWDRFAAATPAHTLMLRDVPAINRIPLPDGSHVDMHDKDDYTRAILAAFRKRGWLPPPGPDN